MKHSEEYIENRIKWRAKRNGLPKKNSHFFNELHPDERRKFEPILESEPIGTPVLVFRAKNNHWTILGTQKIASGSDSSVHTIEYTQIVDSTIGDDPFGQFSSKKPTKLSLFLFRLRKFKQDRILVTEKGGKVITLYGPKGEEIYEVYNIMLMIQRIWKDVE
jgi:hypothetical protein